MNFKQFLAHEAAVRDLNQNFYIVKKERPNNAILDLVYLDRQNLPNSKVIGSIRIYKSNKCHTPLWHVTSVNAQQGYGPLLYDLAMEYATQQQGFLARDIASTTDAAQNIWDYYFTKRNDVSKHPIPQECNKTNRTITTDALNYMYQKQPTESNRLQQHFVQGQFGQDSLDSLATHLNLQ